MITETRPRVDDKTDVGLIEYLLKESIKTNNICIRSSKTLECLLGKSRLKSLSPNPEQTGAGIFTIEEKNLELEVLMVSGASTRSHGVDKTQTPKQK